MERANRSAAFGFHVMRRYLWQAVLLCVTTGFMASLPAGCDAPFLNKAGESGRQLPKLAAARALSSHYVELTFAEAAEGESAAAAQYVIKDPQGRSLEVSRVEPTGDPTRVLLVTGRQEPVSYGLRVNPPATVDGVEADVSPELQFAGANGPEPCIIYAIALNNTQVLITFDLAMEAATVNNTNRTSE
jgi:hypothetical protein